MKTRNLQKLANYLKTLPPENFSMEVYGDEDHNNNMATECGTIGCAIGHGPNAGFPKNPGESWFDYSQRTFGGDAWSWCFSKMWTSYDDTPTGAADRIEYLLEHKHPGEFPWR